MLHSLSRDRGEGDQSVFSQILIAIFEDENDICFFSHLLETSQGHHTFSKTNRPQLC